MLIACPYCGPRDLSEFSYQGDATRSRPDPANSDPAAWNAWVYERANPAGWHREFWQHSGGCRAHLIIARNTLTHDIGEITFARRTLVPGDASPVSRAAISPAPAPKTRPKRAAARPAALVDKPKTKRTATSGRRATKPGKNGAKR